MSHFDTSNPLFNLSKIIDAAMEDRHGETASSSDGPISAVSVAAPPPRPPPNPELENRQNSDPNTSASIAHGLDENREKVLLIPYTVPEWSCCPSQKFYLEVIKDGCIIEELNVSEKGAYMFGRVDLCDFVLEHQTVSRFHAVLQFKASEVAYIFDLGSTHGTSINKNKIEKRTYVEIHVGDVVRFGLSSRLYIFQGPPGLMPPENDMKIVRDAKVRQEIRDCEASLLRARKEASMANGISWGMQEDAIDEPEDEIDDVTWQSFKGQLTEKQEKTRGKIMKRMEKVAHMRKEIQAIRAKDIPQGGLTQGQQTQIARNEQRIAQIFEELESLEETLNDSIRESIGAHRGLPSRDKRKRLTEEDEYLSDDDEFYDRTKKRVMQKANKNQTVETAETLLDKRDSIMKQIEEKKKIRLEEKRSIKSHDSGNSESRDSLDSYMHRLSSQLVTDKAELLEEELSQLQAELNRVSSLLKLADPCGDAEKQRSIKADKPAPVVAEPHVSSTKTHEEPPKQTITKHEAKVDVPEEGAVYAPAEPLLLGAVDGGRNTEKGEVVEEEGDSSPFVEYKDRNKILLERGGEVKPCSDIESAKGGLILRKRNETETSRDTCAPASVDSRALAEDVVSLMLRHMKGYHVEEDDEEEQKGGSGDSCGTPGHHPEKPLFLGGDSGYDSWIPPEGQSGDGRTSLNERYGY